MTFCEGSDVFDFRNACTRDFWSSIVPATLVGFFIFCSLPVPVPRFVAKVLRRLKAPFLPAITVRESEAIAATEGAQPIGEVVLPELDPNFDRARATRWQTATFGVLTALQLLGWLFFGVYHLIRQDAPLPWSFFLVAFSWIYAFGRVLHRPPVTPLYDLFALFLVDLVAAGLRLGGYLYENAVWGAPLPARADLIAEIVNLVLVLSVLVLTVNLPLNIPGNDIDPEKIGTTISPEDYTTLWRWMSFTWVWPLIKLGSNSTLKEDDVWSMTPTMTTKTTLWILKQTTGKRIIWRILQANSMDLIIDFVLTEISSCLDFAGPFFLMQILKGIQDDAPNRSYLFILAFLPFVASVLRSQADLQHLWYGRRAATRVSTQLSAAVYEKALKLRDQSGMVVHGGTADAEATKKAVSKDADANGKANGDHKGRKKYEPAEKKDGEKKASGMDVGKIVNLLGIDVTKVSNQVVGMSMIYVAPLQLVLSCVFLFKILGWSAFAGFLPIVLVIPITQKLAKLTTKIQRATLSAKDDRMKIVNEMFGSIKFIKWFGWEDLWISRVMAARAVEMKWLKKARDVSVAYAFVWNLVPSLVSMISFLVYVYLGNKLTVATAFTAIRLFDMLRMPLNMLPFALVQYAQVSVSLERLDAFLSEGEIPSYVSSLSRTVGPEEESVELSVESATFRWHEAGSSPKTEGKQAVASNDAPAGKVLRSSSASTVTVGNSDTDTTFSSGLTAVEGESSESSDDNLFELRDITVKFPRGKLTLVTGPTASGKTALLMALLGEMDLQPGGKHTLPKNSKSADEHGLINSIAYSAQTPWLQQQSIKENIVFGYSFDKERYEAVLDACALRPDLERLEDGDSTEIGSKGVSLSGGQKARVALARAAYSPAMYVLLDDPLSAVDSHTARFLYDKLFLGPILKHRTVVLITHHVELVLPGASYIIRMLNGRIDVQGTVDHLEAQGLLDRIKAEDTVTRTEVDGPAKSGEDSEAPAAPSLVVETTRVARKLVEDEARAEGKVKWPIYKTYLKATSYLTWGIVLFGVIISQVFSLGEKIWISIWGSAYGSVQLTHTYSMSSFTLGGYTMSQVDHNRIAHFSLIPARQFIVAMNLRDRLPSADDHPFFYVGVYSAIGVLSAAVSIACRWTVLTGGLRGAGRLFKMLLTSVTRATMRWYDTTPTGRILNRFGKDIDTLDSTLAFIVNMTVNSIAQFAAAVITVAVVIPGFIPAGVILSCIYFKLSIGYLNTGRDLKRMESTSRSPILSGFGDLVEGIVTVRAFGAEERFLANHFNRVDLMTKFYYFTWMLNRWLFLYFDLLGGTSVFVATLFVLIASTSAGMAGLVIVSAMNFSMSVYWTCRGWTELELALNSVERVVEYVQEIPEEPPAIIASNRPPAYWPSGSLTGSLVVVEDLEVKYSPELPSVLRNISFTLKAQERVGLLGRTGSGKSTLAMSFLRFADPIRGRIIIDGIDITTIGVHDLRSRLTLIPQDAALFAGTIRDNLDPFDEHTDEECLDVLHRVHMISETAGIRTSQETSRSPSVLGEASIDHDSLALSDTLTQVDGTKGQLTLSTQVSAGGNNFSSGQRQLLAMARALLRQSAVVIMDEATSQIDLETDIKIQATIREEFKNSLLITVAHRLRTIIDYDRLLVLEDGEIAESGTPYDLIRKENGIFRTMCLQSGSFAELEAIARDRTGK